VDIEVDYYCNRSGKIGAGKFKCEGKSTGSISTIS
jgi:hypothetical protein